MKTQTVDLVVWKQQPGDTAPIAWTTITVESAAWAEFSEKPDSWLPFALQGEEELWRAFNFVDEEPSPASKFAFHSPALWVSPRSSGVKFRKETVPADARRSKRRHRSVVSPSTADGRTCALGSREAALLHPPQIIRL